MLFMKKIFLLLLIGVCHNIIGRRRTVVHNENNVTNIKTILL